MSRTDRSAGRPRSLTMPRIIDAAIALGLRDLNMKALAAALGVNPVTLYRHVGSRDQLMQIAATHLMGQRRLQGDTGGHWAEFVFQYAGNLFDLFRHEPGLITELLNGNLHPDAEMDLLEEFLQIMSSYGFSHEEGALLHRSIGGIALGSAVGAIGVQATLERGRSWGETVDDVLAARNCDELPAVRQIARTLVEYDVHRWLQILYTFLYGVAAERGETLPDIDTLLAAAGDSSAGAP